MFANMNSFRLRSERTDFPFFILPFFIFHLNHGHCVAGYLANEVSRLVSYLAS